MRALLRFLGYLWSYFYSPWINKKCKAVKFFLYTGYYARQFKSIGKATIIKPSFRFVCGLQYISIGSNSVIGKEVELTAWDNYKGQQFKPEIIIGDGSSIQSYAHVTAINSICIGNGVRIGPNVLITDNAHGASVAELLDTAPNLRPLSSKGPVVIEDNVWIGTKASIMPGVRIGKGAIIAANSVVTHDIPSYCVAAGVPAKVIKIIREP